MLPLLGGFRNDHFDHDGQAVDRVEHALGTAQADTPGAELQRACSIFRRIRVGHHAQIGDLIGP